MTLEKKIFELKREILKLQEAVIRKDRMILNIVENGVTSEDYIMVLGVTADDNTPNS